MPKQCRFTKAERKEISQISSRKAMQKFGIAFATWTKIKADPEFIPEARRRNPEATEAMVDRILKSVKEVPHINTAERARQLGYRTASVQKILAERGLGHLNARLQRAGYKVEVIRPLQVARMRRIVATHPGSLTHIDYKTFGFLRGQPGQKGQRLGGYVVIDSLTAFATVLLTSTPNASDACAALEKHITAAPFKLKGIVFSDNGPTDFLSDLYIEFVASKGLLQRTTKFSSPWSNGKCEAMNKTLKYQCFPAIAAANVAQWNAVERLVDAWIDFYNANRAHSGFVLRGLPPLVFYKLWEETPGDHLDRLVKLGVIKLDSEWDMRYIGQQPGNAGKRPGGDVRSGSRSGGSEGLPYALVLEKTRVANVTKNNGDVSHTTFIPATPGTGEVPKRIRTTGVPDKCNIVLAK